MGKSLAPHTPKLMLYSKKKNGFQHRDGHVFGKRPKKTSIGNGKRKRGSLSNTKKYRGQGR